MAYNSWNEKKIKKQIRKSSISEEMGILCNLLSDDCTPFEFESDITNEDKKRMDNIVLEEYKYYMEEIDKLSKTKVKCHIKYLNDIGVSNQELFTVTHDYFKQFDATWFKIFMSVFKDRKNNLIIGGDENKTIYLPSIDYSYIKVEKNDSIQDYFNLIHEYTHAIVDRMRYRHDYLCGYPFIELPSLLNEILLCDYLNEIYIGVEDDIRTYFNSLIKTIVDFAKRIKDCYYKGTYDKDYMIKYLSYVIPMLEVIELYYEFLNDKEKGISILTDIIMMDNVPNYLDYTKRLGLIPNQNVKNIISKFNKR